VEVTKRKCEEFCQVYLGFL